MVKIMLVDDNIEIASLFGEILTDAGFEVDTFTDSLTALNSCVSVRYSLVIADVGMPGIDGMSLIQMIRAQRPGMPYIFLSGRNAPNSGEVIQNADAFILKTAAPRELVGKLVEVLALKGGDAGTSQALTAL